MGKEYRRAEKFAGRTGQNPGQSTQVRNSQLNSQRKENSQKSNKNRTNEKQAVLTSSKFIGTCDSS